MQAEWNASGTLQPYLINVQGYDTKIEATLPSILGKLTSLTLLILESNLFYGTIPSQWGGMTSMKMLLINGNRISGTLPEELSSWSSVTWIDLSWNLLTGTLPSSYCSFSSLVSVFLHSNELSGSIPSCWERSLHSLEIFDIANTSISGSLPKFNSPNLKSLYFEDTEISGEIPFEWNQYPNLKDVTIPQSVYGCLPSCSNQVDSCIIGGSLSCSCLNYCIGYCNTSFQYPLVVPCCNQPPGTLCNNGTLYIPTHSTITAPPIISGSLVVGAFTTLILRDAISVLGFVTLNETSSLVISLIDDAFANPTAMAVSGNIQFEGTLQITSNKTSFPNLITFSSRTGNFTHVFLNNQQVENCRIVYETAFSIKSSCDEGLGQLESKSYSALIGGIVGGVVFLVATFGVIYLLYQCKQETLMIRRLTVPAPVPPNPTPKT
uniref:Uncharacterized protein n=1 Tax=Arcella intermedia TaxID=1963864 RepID=A0A6B2L4H3_9EUKA